MEGKVCTKCGVWKPLKEYHKNKAKKDGRQYKCRECTKKYGKQYNEVNKEKIKEQQKQYREVNKEKKKEYDKQYHKDNAEHFKQYYKQYHKDNAERKKQYYKQHYKDNIENNLQYISSIVEQIRPIFKELSLPVYGYIYKVTNVKTKHTYTGQTKLGLSLRYGSNIIKSWIAERKEKTNQKFIDELIEENLTIEIIDVGCCQYHLDKLEVYWINYYDSYNNGYNNNAGYHDTDDGLEEFIEILEQHNLEFIDGQIVKKAN
jgi:hypothetical protein